MRAEGSMLTGCVRVRPPPPPARVSGSNTLSALLCAVQSVHLQCGVGASLPPLADVVLRPSLCRLRQVALRLLQRALSSCPAAL